ncbi:MAG TPA: hypothetical protein VFB30_05040, partial [Spirochaetia bacterium]|nr:hypothetical protein [Spirochaetia bacterium]
RSFDVVGVIDALSAAYLVALLIVGLVPLFALTLMLLPIYSAVYRGFAMQSNANLSFICDVVADSEYVLWGPLMYIGKLLI